MTFDPAAKNPRHTFGRLLYVLLLAVALFFIHRPEWLLGLLALQLILWIGSGLSARALWSSTFRLRLLFFFIVVSYALISTGDNELDRWWEVPLGYLAFDINLAGLTIAAFMCLRVLILVMASAWMQRTAAPGALVDALRKLHLPETLAMTVDATLLLLGSAAEKGDKQRNGGGQGTGDGGGRSKHQKPGKRLSWQELKAGNLGGVGKLIDDSLLKARDFLAARYPGLGDKALHDMTIVLAVCLALMGLKLFQILPGIPIASGHKNLIVVPLLLYAAYGTHARFGGLLAGTTVGIVSFLLGYGKYGVLEISHFALPGLLADLLMPWLNARSRIGRLAQFAFAGLVLGAGRFVANLLVIMLAGAPLPAFVLFAPMLISQLVFGAISCVASVLIVNSSRLPGGAKAGENNGQ